jgi:hypothetical protein
MNDENQPMNPNGDQQQPPGLSSQPVMAFGPEGEPPLIMIYADGNVDIKVGVSLSDVAIQFWKTVGKQSPLVMLREDAMREINQSMTMVAAMIYMAGGEVRIPAMIPRVLPKQLSISRNVDPLNNDMILRLVTAPRIIVPNGGG